MRACPPSNLSRELGVPYPSLASSTLSQDRQSFRNPDASLSFPDGELYEVWRLENTAVVDCPVYAMNLRERPTEASTTIESLGTQPKGRTLRLRCGFSLTLDRFP